MILNAIHRPHFISGHVSCRSKRVDAVKKESSTRAQNTEATLFEEVYPCQFTTHKTALLLSQSVKPCQRNSSPPNRYNCCLRSCRTERHRFPLQMLQRQSPTHFTSTGISPQLQQQFEARSEFCFSDVRVHYNSGHPAKFCTWAYTRGTRMHLRPDQEQHLPYELGHVVQ